MKKGRGVYNKNTKISNIIKSHLQRDDSHPMDIEHECGKMAKIQENSRENTEIN